MTMEPTKRTGRRVGATFAPCRDDARAANERRNANHDATRANVGEHGAFRLAEIAVRLAQIWLVPPVRSAQVRSD
jgi:hypothetical protein